MRICTALLALFVASTPALGQNKGEPLQSACASGDPWYLPAAPAGGETAMLIVAGAVQPIQIRLCNCGAKEDGRTYLRVNPNTTTPEPPKKPAATKKGVETTASATAASQLYVGSCLEAVGNTITIRNTLQKDQRGTYQLRGAK